MTTVVFTETQVAADGRMIDGYGTISGSNYKKLFENDRYIVGISGGVGQCLRVKDWIFNDFLDDEGEAVKPHIGDREEVEYNVIFVDKSDNRIYCVEGIGFDIIELEYPAAMGSGASYALGYMQAKRKNTKDLAVKAVKAASKLDPGTNDNVRVIEINPL
jgi:ATP-dependent protease HslVU (ClpYQ) peptidase subunit